MALTHRPTIEDFGLVRLLYPHFDIEEIMYLSPFVWLGHPNPNEPTPWRPSIIADPDRIRQSDDELGIPSHYRLSLYAVCPALGIYSVTSVFPPIDDDGAVGAYASRRAAEEMRPGDMMLDNYVAAGGNPRTWRWVGFGSDAVRADRGALRAMAANFEAAGVDWLGSTTRVSVEYAPSERIGIVHHNEYTRSVASLIAQHGATHMGGARIKRVIFVSRGGYEMPHDYYYTEYPEPGSRTQPSLGESCSTTTNGHNGALANAHSSFTNGDFDSNGGFDAHGHSAHSHIRQMVFRIRTGMGTPAPPSIPWTWPSSTSWSSSSGRETMAFRVLGMLASRLGEDEE
ncbi:hypothetical protein F5Y17DRAFT_109765 [Xylariaceae sp. FL0594]|nr:hypothetical protein F5Y17DRAFT_109765 [Xylariaceae sp. FL0594]